MPDPFTDLWTQLWEWLDGHPSGDWYFRGQAGSFAVVPKIGRLGHLPAPAEEKALFDAFRRAARPLASTRINNDGEWLALAQHHGMPTRLVDWSSSPLIACWFAVTSNPQGESAYVYALDVSRSDLEVLSITDAGAKASRSGGSYDDPFALRNSIALMEAAEVTHRITNQRGVFTIYAPPDKELNVDVADIFEIDKALRPQMQRRLFDIGIDDAHIYPGIDGLCRSLDWRARTNNYPRPAV